MKKQKLFRLLTLVFTLTIMASMALNAAALIDDPTRFSTNIPDREIDRREAATGNTTDTGTAPEDTKKQTGAVDDALDKASEALDDVTGALGDMKDDVEDMADDATNGNSFVGIVIAILIAVAIIILIIVMVSKNTEKNNRK